MFEHIKGAVESLEIENRKQALNIAFVHSIYHKQNEIQGEIFKAKYNEWLLANNLNGRLIISFIDEIVLRNNSYYYDNIIIHQILDLEDINSDKIDSVYKSNKVNLRNGSITSLLTNKLNLALLSENEGSDIFTNEENEVINNHIPWTRKLENKQTNFKGIEVNIKEYVAENKEKFVIKPSYGLGGDNVSIGTKISKKEWQEILYNRKEDEVYVVQELLILKSTLIIKNVTSLIFTKQY